MSSSFETPYFLLHEERLQANLERLKQIEERAEVKILHTLKSFNEMSLLPLVGSTLSGMSIASENELAMAQKAEAKQIHLYAPAFKASQLETMSRSIDTLSFNSLGQYQAFQRVNVSKGLRINPKLHLPIPDHCNPNLDHSRLGVDAREFLTAFESKREDFKALEGLHLHALFQSSAEGTALLLDFLQEHFKEILPQLKWLNLGGGHNFTDLDYDVDRLCQIIEHFKRNYPNIDLFFEPGESVTKGCGEFVATVLDIVNIAGEELVILDTSVETHLLDVAIANMRLKVKGTQSEATPYFYELTGNSCMQGDSIGVYFFQEQLHIGDQVVFENMLGYTMVKMTEFNGMEKARLYVV